MIGRVVYADDPEMLAMRLESIPPESAVAVFSRKHYDPSKRVGFFRVRATRNPEADLAAVRVKFPAVQWRGPQGPGKQGRSSRSGAVRLRRNQFDDSLCIEAVAVACGGKLSEELELFVRQFTFHNREMPLYVLTDEATAAALSDEVKSWIEVLDVVSEEVLQSFSGSGPEQGRRWSRPWIGAKIEVLRRAVKKWGCGVLFCDSDLIFTGRIPDLEWDADVVLSTHRGPFPDGAIPAFHGRYNAGLLLTKHLAVVDQWRDYFVRGVGDFLEQQCLERFATDFVVDTFPAAWNWGGWRKQEDLSVSQRRPLILHTHIIGPYQSVEMPPPSLRSVKEQAREAVERREMSEGTPDKIAFIHFAKAAGTSMGLTLRTAVATERCYQWLGRVRFDGPRHVPGTVVGRDYSPSELAAIAEGHYRALKSDRWIVHNHAQNWDEHSVSMMVDSGVELFAFYRPILDRLLSFHTWSRGLLAAKGWTPLLEPAGSARNFDEFLEAFLDDRLFEPEWALPDWHGQINHWYPAHSGGMIAACQDLFGLEIAPETRNASANSGWDQAVAEGSISKKWQKRTLEDPRVKAWQAFGASSGLQARYDGE